MTKFYYEYVLDEYNNVSNIRMLSDIQATSGDRLAVPYHSQWDSDAGAFKSDCGPTCVQMVGEFLTSEDHTTDEIMDWIVDANRSTSSVELANAAREFYGVSLIRTPNSTWEALKAQIAKELPIIVLVHYGSFVMRLDRGYTGGHWMVVVGFDDLDRIILHDPDWWGVYRSQGEAIAVTKEHFNKMWTDCYIDGNPNNFALYSRVV